MKQGFSDRVAREIVAVEAGNPPDSAPAEAFALPEQRPTGQEIFDSKSPAEQDAMLGPKAAAAVRAGDVSLEQLVQRSPLDSDQPDFITQKPLPQEGTDNAR
jgi:hypothetical protein